MSDSVYILELYITYKNLIVLKLIILWSVGDFLKLNSFHIFVCLIEL